MNYLGIDISEEEFIEMDEFPLSWRFTDPKYNLLPQSDLSKILPLNDKVANKLISKASGFISNSSLIDNHESFKTYVDEIETSSVINWLLSKEPKSEQQVLVLYCFSPKAAICPWDIFVKYWDDFCYPSSNDVFILPSKESWVLFYSHEEIFQYIKR